MRRIILFCASICIFSTCSVLVARAQFPSLGHIVNQETMTKAYTAFEKGDYQECIRLCDNILIRNPAHSEARKLKEKARDVILGRVFKSSRALMEVSLAFNGMYHAFYKDGKSVGIFALGFKFDYVFQSRYVLGGVGYSFSIPAFHYFSGLIGGQYHWGNFTLQGVFRLGYRASFGVIEGPEGFKDLPINSWVGAVSAVAKFYPHPSVPLRAEFTISQGRHDTAVGFSLGLGTKGWWVLAAIGGLGLVVLGIVSSD